MKHPHLKTSSHKTSPPKTYISVNISSQNVPSMDVASQNVHSGKIPSKNVHCSKYPLPKRYLRKHLLPKRFLMKRHLPKRPLTIRSQRQTASDTKHPLRKFKRFSFSRLSSSNFLFKFFSVLDTSKSHLSLPPFLHLIYFHKIPFFAATF